MKRRMITAALVLLFFYALTPLMGYNAHMCLSGQMPLCSTEIKTVIAGLAIPQVRQFTLLGICCASLAVGWMLLSQSYIKYRNGMRRILPTVWTPAPAGEGQYGTAHWMEPREYSEAFQSAMVDSGCGRIHELIVHGRDDMKKGAKNDEM